MAFVDHDIAKSAQEDRPAGVIAQHRHVDHVRVGEQPAGTLTREAADLGAGVTVVRTRRDVTEAGHRSAQCVRAAQLIMAECFRR